MDKETKVLSVRMSKELYDKLEKYAKEKDRYGSVASYVRLVLGKHVKEKENE